MAWTVKLKMLALYDDRPYIKPCRSHLPHHIQVKKKCGVVGAPADIRMSTFRNLEGPKLQAHDEWTFILGSTQVAKALEGFLVLDIRP